MTLTLNLTQAGAGSTSKYQHVKYPGHFVRKLLFWHTETHIWASTLPGPLKWSVKWSVEIIHWPYPFLICQLTHEGQDTAPIMLADWCKGFGVL